MPRLTELRIDVFATTLSPRPAIPIADETNRSPLSVLHLHNSGIFDTTNLTSTTISDLLVGGVAQLSTRLDEWELRSRCSFSLTTLVSSVGFYEENTLPIIHLPNLKRLATSLRAMRGVPKTILCPNLEELVLYNTRRDNLTDPPIVDLVSPLPQHYFPWPKLRVLIGNAHFHDTEHARILNALPTLFSITYIEDHAEIASSHLGTDIIGCLAAHPGIVPKLEMIKVEPPWLSIGSSVNALVTALERLWTIRPLLRVECYESDITYVQDALDALSENHPNQFTHIEGTHGGLEYLYDSLWDVKADEAEDIGDMGDSDIDEGGEDDDADEGGDSGGETEDSRVSETDEE